MLLGTVFKIVCAILPVEERDKICRQGYQEIQETRGWFSEVLMSGSQVCELDALPYNCFKNVIGNHTARCLSVMENVVLGSSVSKKGDSYSLLDEQIIKMLLSHNVSIVVCNFLLESN